MDKTKVKGLDNSNADNKITGRTDSTETDAIFHISFTGNVSNVYTMYQMFYSADSFNGDISDWDVSSVINMRDMFAYAISFNQDISSWNVSNVYTTYQMFYSADSFNGDISDWDISSVTSMNYMFNGANDLSDDNKCAIHTSFSSNENWPYDWEEYCSD